MAVYEYVEKELHSGITARRGKICELLQETEISNMADIQSLFRETFAESMENELEAKPDEALSYEESDRTATGLEYHLRPANDLLRRLDTYLGFTPA